MQKADSGGFKYYWNKNTIIGRFIKARREESTKNTPGKLCWSFMEHSENSFCFKSHFWKDLTDCEAYNEP